VRQPNIAAALTLGAIALTVAYGGAWVMLPGMIEASEGGTRASYEVVTEGGQREVLEVDVDDPAAVLTEATRRFGMVQSLRRIEGGKLGRATLLSGARRWAAWAMVLPLLMLIAARFVHGRARRMAAVWEALRPTLSGDLSALAKATGLGEAQLRAQIERINRHGLARLSIHEAAGRVADARLSNHGINISHCPHCNERAPAHARADLVQLPRCPSCLHEYPRAQLAQQIEGLVATLIAAPPPPPRGAPPQFSAGLFALLVIVFPPLAILHALRAAG
jgi:hypothetical protein